MNVVRVITRYYIRFTLLAALLWGHGKFAAWNWKESQFWQEKALWCEIMWIKSDQHIK